MDGTFGIIAGVKREGFKTYKALGFLRSTFVWLMILFGVLSIEYSFNGTNWLSETLIVPFLVIQLASALKNASMAGYIKSEVVNAILARSLKTLWSIILLFPYIAHILFEDASSLSFMGPDFLGNFPEKGA